MSTGTIELVDDEGRIVGHGFIEQEAGGVQRQRWVLVRSYVSPGTTFEAPMGAAVKNPAIIMRPARSPVADLAGWLAALESGWWYDGAQYIEATCRKRQAEEEQILIKDTFIGVYQEIAGAEGLTLVGGVTAVVPPAGESARDWKSFSGKEIAPMQRLDEHWLLRASFTPPPAGTIQLRASNEAAHAIMLDASHAVVVECAMFAHCPDLGMTAGVAMV